MNIRELLLMEHALIHSAAVATAADTQVAEIIWSRTNDGERRKRPPGHNSIAWIMWHLARVEDVDVNAMLRGEPELLDREVWLPRLGVEARDIGTGASDDEVDVFSQQIDLGALKEYRDAVGRESREWLMEADLGQLDELIDVDARRSETPPYFDPERAAWMRSTGGGRQAASFWTWGVIGHSLVHLGEAAHVTVTLGLPGR
jgi:hypothetical protein